MFIDAKICGLKDSLLIFHCSKLYREMKYVGKHGVDAFLFLAADIYEKVSGELEKGGHLDCECVGGGRIKHDPDAKKIHVYGYSMVRESCWIKTEIM